MFTLVWLVILWCNYSHAENGITYNNNLTTWTDLNWNSFKYWTITIEHDWESITMMDRNLWATTNNTNSNGSFWYYYQRWNNYWFSSNLNSLTTWENLVDTSPYWPWNYYSRAIYNILPRNEAYARDRSTVRNDNLWWWSWDNFDNNYLWYPVTNPVDRQWPCPNGYHVPSMWERIKVMEWWALNYNWAWYGNPLRYDDWGRPVLSGWISNFRSDFLIPESKSFYTDRSDFENLYNIHESLNYLQSSSSIPYKSWDQTPEWFVIIRTDYRENRWLWLYNSTIYVGSSQRDMAAPVRCFKNPDNTINWNNSTVNENLPSSVWNSNSHNFEYDYSKLNPNYSNEINQAYQYAYHYWITTINNISNANMNGWLTRIAMAKMLSNYAINILWLTPDTTKNCHFSDVSNSLNAQYDNWVTKACQLGLMGVWINQFHPNTKVTRAEFGTVLSRALNAKDTTKLTQMNNAEPYYYEHLRYLKREGIMNKISNPGSLELRWYVMLMLMRADKNYVPEEIEMNNFTSYHSPNMIDMSNILLSLDSSEPESTCNRTEEVYRENWRDYRYKPNNKRAADARFVNNVLQDVRNNWQHLVQNYMIQANEILDSAWLTNSDRCRYSFLIYALENQRWELTSYKTQNWVTTIWVDFYSYKETLDKYDIDPAGWTYYIYKNTSKKSRNYTLSEDPQLEVLKVDNNWHTNAVYYNGTPDTRSYVSNWNTWINTYCNNEIVYNWKSPDPDNNFNYNWNTNNALCIRNRLSNPWENPLTFTFDALWNISKIGGFYYWLDFHS